MKKTAISLVFLLLFSLTACAPEKQPEKQPEEQSAYTELLLDGNFESGFNLYGPDSRYHAANYWDQVFFEKYGNPVWKLDTWGCFVNYYLNRELTFTEDGKTYTYPARPVSVTRKEGLYEFSNPSYTVKVNPGTGFLSLKADSSAEYGVTPAYTDAPRASSPRKGSEAWPHLLVEENISDPVSLGEVEKVIYTLDFQIPSVQLKMKDSDFNPDAHTAIIVWYVSIACANPFSGFYNQYIWFGVPIYDYRTRLIPESANIDGVKEDSTGMLIYCTPSENYFPEGVAYGERYKLERDFYPAMQTAFVRAQQMNLFTDCTLSDMRFINTNIGWELLGDFDATLEIYDLSIRYKEVQ